MSPFHLSLSPAQRVSVAWLGILLIVGLLLWLLGNVLTPFVIAAVLAYVLNPAVNKLIALGRGKISRALSVSVVIVVFLLLIASILMLVLPIALHELPRLQAQIPVVLDSLVAGITPYMAKLGLPFSLEVETPKSLIAKWLQSGNTPDAAAIIGHVASTLKVGGSVAVALLANALLIPLVLFYLLMDWPRLVAGSVELVPKPWRAAFIRLGREIDTTLGQYLRGQLSVMAVMATFYTVGLAIGGLQLALPIGVFTGLALFVPYVGFGFGLLMAMTTAFLQFGLIKALILVGVVYGLGQLLESFYLTPKWVGERIGLHPILVIFALMAFGQLFGFIGMLVALPLSAALYVLVRELLQRYKTSSLYQGMGPR